MRRPGDGAGGPGPGEEGRLRSGLPGSWEGGWEQGTALPAGHVGKTPGGSRWKGSRQAAGGGSRAPSTYQALTTLSPLSVGPPTPHRRQCHCSWQGRGPRAAGGEGFPAVTAPAGAELVHTRSGAPRWDPSRRFRGVSLKLVWNRGGGNGTAPATGELASLSAVSGVTLGPGGQGLGNPCKDHARHAGISGVPWGALHKALLNWTPESFCSTDPSSSPGGGPFKARLGPPRPAPTLGLLGIYGGFLWHCSGGTGAQIIKAPALPERG